MSDYLESINNIGNGRGEEPPTKPLKKEKDGGGPIIPPITGGPAPEPPDHDGGGPIIPPITGGPAPEPYPNPDPTPGPEPEPETPISPVPGGSGENVTPKVYSSNFEKDLCAYDDNLYSYHFAPWKDVIYSIDYVPNMGGQRFREVNINTVDGPTVKLNMNKYRFGHTDRYDVLDENIDLEPSLLKNIDKYVENYNRVLKTNVYAKDVLGKTPKDYFEYCGVEENQLNNTMVKRRICSECLNAFLKFDCATDRVGTTTPTGYKNLEYFENAYLNTKTLKNLTSTDYNFGKIHNKGVVTGSFKDFYNGLIIQMPDYIRNNHPDCNSFFRKTKVFDCSYTNPQNAGKLITSDIFFIPSNSFFFRNYVYCSDIGDNVSFNFSSYRKKEKNMFISKYEYFENIDDNERNNNHSISILVPDGLKKNRKLYISHHPDVSTEFYNNHQSNIKDIFFKNPDETSKLMGERYTDFINDILITKEKIFSNTSFSNLNMSSTNTFDGVAQTDSFPHYYPDYRKNGPDNYYAGYFDHVLEKFMSYTCCNYYKYSDNYHHFTIHSIIDNGLAINTNSKDRCHTYDSFNDFHNACWDMYRLNNKIIFKYIYPETTSEDIFSEDTKLHYEKYRPFNGQSYSVSDEESLKNLNRCFIYKDRSNPIYPHRLKRGYIRTTNGGPLSWFINWYGVDPYLESSTAYTDPAFQCNGKYLYDALDINELTDSPEMIEIKKSIERKIKKSIDLLKPIFTPTILGTYCALNNISNIGYESITNPLVKDNIDKAEYKGKYIVNKKYATNYIDYLRDNIMAFSNTNNTLKTISDYGIFSGLISFSFVYWVFLFIKHGLGTKKNIQNIIKLYDEIYRNVFNRNFSDWGKNLNILHAIYDGYNSNISYTDIIQYLSVFLYCKNDADVGIKIRQLATNPNLFTLYIKEKDNIKNSIIPINRIIVIDEHMQNIKCQKYFSQINNYDYYKTRPTDQIDGFFFDIVRNKWVQIDDKNNKDVDLSNIPAFDRKIFNPMNTPIRNTISKNNDSINYPSNITFPNCLSSIVRYDDYIDRLEIQYANSHIYNVAGNYPNYRLNSYMRYSASVLEPIYDLPKLKKGSGAKEQLLLDHDKQTYHIHSTMFHPAAYMDWNLVYNNNYQFDKNKMRQIVKDGTSKFGSKIHNVYYPVSTKRITPNRYRIVTDYKKELEEVEELLKEHFELQMQWDTIFDNLETDPDNIIFNNDFQKWLLELQIGHLVAYRDKLKFYIRNGITVEHPDFYNTQIGLIKKGDKDFHKRTFEGDNFGKNKEFNYLNKLLVDKAVYNAFDSTQFLKFSNSYNEIYHMYSIPRVGVNDFQRRILNNYEYPIVNIALKNFGGDATPNHSISTLRSIMKMMFKDAQYLSDEYIWKNKDDQNKIMQQSYITKLASIIYTSSLNEYIDKASDLFKKYDTVNDAIKDIYPKCMDYEYKLKYSPTGLFYKSRGEYLLLHPTMNVENVLNVDNSDTVGDFESEYEHIYPVKFIRPYKGLKDEYYGKGDTELDEAIERLKPTEKNLLFMGRDGKIYGKIFNQDHPELNDYMGIDEINRFYEQNEGFNYKNSERLTGIKTNNDSSDMAYHVGTFGHHKGLFNRFIQPIGSFNRLTALESIIPKELFNVETVQKENDTRIVDYRLTNLLEKDQNGNYKKFIFRFFTKVVTDNNYQTVPIDEIVIDYRLLTNLFVDIIFLSEIVYCLNNDIKTTADPNRYVYHEDFKIYKPSSENEINTLKGYKKKIIEIVSTGQGYPYIMDLPDRKMKNVTDICIDDRAEFKYHKTLIGNTHSLTPRYPLIKLNKDLKTIIMEVGLYDKFLYENMSNVTHEADIGLRKYLFGSAIIKEYVKEHNIDDNKNPYDKPIYDISNGVLGTSIFSNFVKSNEKIMNKLFDNSFHYQNSIHKKKSNEELTRSNKPEYQLIDKFLFKSYKYFTKSYIISPIYNNNLLPFYIYQTYKGDMGIYNSDIMCNYVPFSNIVDIFKRYSEYYGSSFEFLYIPRSSRYDHDKINSVIPYDISVTHFNFMETYINPRNNDNFSKNVLRNKVTFDFNLSNNHLKVISVTGSLDSFYTILATRDRNDLFLQYSETIYPDANKYMFDKQTCTQFYDTIQIVAPTPLIRDCLDFFNENNRDYNKINMYNLYNIDEEIIKRVKRIDPNSELGSDLLNEIYYPLSTTRLGVLLDDIRIPNKITKYKGDNHNLDMSVEFGPFFCLKNQKISKYGTCKSRYDFDSKVNSSNPLIIFKESINDTYGVKILPVFYDDKYNKYSFFETMLDELHYTDNIKRKLNDSCYNHFYTDTNGEIELFARVWFVAKGYKDIRLFDLSNGFINNVSDGTVINELFDNQSSDNPTCADIRKLTFDNPTYIRKFEDLNNDIYDKFESNILKAVYGDDENIPEHNEIKVIDNNINYSKIHNYDTKNSKNILIVVNDRVISYGSFLAGRLGVGK